MSTVLWLLTLYMRLGFLVGLGFQVLGGFLGLVTRERGKGRRVDIVAVMKEILRRDVCTNR